MSVEETPAVDSAALRARLQEVLARLDVPGASIAVLSGGQVSSAAAGVLNLDTGVEATEDSLFQIGSITKPYTATLVMQLVDEGRADLDAPAATYLPELRLTDAEVARAVTLRHLLTHSSGIAGDHFPDLGRGEDVVARYVASCSEVGQTHPLGATMSYCNAGFVIAGRIVEQLTGESWDDALATRIAAPLGVSHTFTHPEDVLRFRSALGHLEQDGRLQTASQWGLPRSCGPCGLICATAADVVAFARMHLDGGRAPDGAPILSPGSVAAMQEPQVEMPDPYIMRASHFGLAWKLYDWGRPVFGHDGGTIGQTAFLRIVPEAGVAVCLLTNGGHAQDLFDGLVGPLLDELAGVTVPPRLGPPDEPVDLALDEYVGTYERLGTRIDVEQRDGRLVGRTTGYGPLADVFPDPVAEFEAVAVGRGIFVARRPGGEEWTPMVFYSLDDGSRYVHSLGRASPRLA